jgi:hypothetical protein
VIGSESRRVCAYRLRACPRPASGGLSTATLVASVPSKSPMDGALVDFRDTVRALRRDPLYAAAAVATVFNLINSSAPSRFLT